MRRVLFGLAVLLSGGLAVYFRCLGKHELRRHWTGAQRCIRCGRGFTDLCDARLMDGGAYVGHLRREFSRDHMEVTQSGWIQ